MSKRKPSGRSLDSLISDDGPPEAPPPVVASREEPAPLSRPIEAAGVGVPLQVLVTLADRKRLKHYSTDVGKSLQVIAHEAFNEYFKARGLPPLQPQASNRASGTRKK